jgi:regulatory protein
VYVDGRLALEVAAVLVTEAGLRPGEFLTAERQAALLEDDQPHRARAVALLMLGRRARCRREVELKLRRCGFADQVAKQTLSWLEAQGYLDDRRFAASYAAEKLKSGWGRRRIVAELGRKGIPRALVEGDAWDEFLPGVDTPVDTEALVGLVERRFGRQLKDDPDGARRRIAGFLSRRGHEWDEITRILRRVADVVGCEQGHAEDR